MSGFDNAGVDREFFPDGQVNPIFSARSAMAANPY
jgi:hypothetical protein